MKLTDLNVESDWDVFAAFLSDPYGGDDACPDVWPYDYVSGLIDEFDWPVYDDPREAHREAEDSYYALVEQACDAIMRELGKADPIDEGDAALTDGGCIYRSVVFGWLE